MSNTPYDQNTVKAKLGVLFSDGVTLIPIAINATNSGMKINTVDTVDAAILALYEAGRAIPRDTDHQPAWCGISDSDPNVTFPIFVDADGAVLIDE